MPENPLSVTQAAARTGIPKRTLQWAIKNGRLKAHKLGDANNAYIIDPDDLNDYLTNRETTS